MRLLGWSRRLLLLKGNRLSPSPQQQHGRIFMPLSLVLVLLWFLYELIQLTWAMQGKKKGSLVFCWRREPNHLAKGLYEHQPQRNGSILLAERGESGFGSFTGSKLFNRFSHLTWLNPKIKHRYEKSAIFKIKIQLCLFSQYIPPNIGNVIAVLWSVWSLLEGRQKISKSECFLSCFLSRKKKYHHKTALSSVINHTWFIMIIHLYILVSLKRIQSRIRPPLCNT